MHIPPLEPLGGVSPRILPSVEHPCKLLKTQARLCIEFYALFSWFNVGERWSLKPSFLLGFGVTSQDRCAAGFPCVPWFLPITDGVGFRSRFPQLIRAELKRACITQVSSGRRCGPAAGSRIVAAASSLRHPDLAWCFGASKENASTRHRSCARCSGEQN